MFGKLGLFLQLFQSGKEVADPTLWKNRQITSNALGAAILALVAVLRAYQIDLPIDNETALIIGGGIVALWNVGLTVATSKKVGLPAKTADNTVVVHGPNIAEAVLPPIEEHEGKSVEAIRQEAAIALSASMSRRSKGYYDDPDIPRNDR